MRKVLLCLLLNLPSPAKEAPVTCTAAAESFLTTLDSAQKIKAANTQNNVNHFHATWRGFDGDFGRDLLGEHFRRDH